MTRGLRFAIGVVSVIGVVATARLGVEQGLPAMSRSAQMFVEMLVIAAAYGLLAWRCLFVPLQRRRMTPAGAGAVSVGQVVPARNPVRAVEAPGLRKERAACPRAPRAMSTASRPRSVPATASPPTACGVDTLFRWVA